MQVDAAIKVQATFRGFQARKQVVEMYKQVRQLVLLRFKLF
jgi:hypothetical protein